MFRWLRRNDGFEWHKYVRTTIKLRRDDRRRRVGEMGHAVAASGQSAAGSAGRAIASPFVWVSEKLFARRAFGVSKAGQAWRSIGETLALPIVRLFAGIVGAALMVSGAASLFGNSVDPTSRLAGFAGIILVLVAAGPLIASYVLLPIGRPVAGMTRRVSGVAQATSTGVTMALGATAVLLVSGGATVAMRILAPSLTAPFTRMVTGSTGLIEGRGTAIGSDLLRVGDTLVRLADIEAPRADQKCAKPNTGSKGRRSTTPCSRAAFESLQARVRGKTVQCTARGKDDSGRLKARCTVGGEDIAQALVRDGYVKTSGGLFASYGSDESVAKAARAGVWASADDAPSETKKRR